MPRDANAVDFWRGFALVTIYVNHTPGLYYGSFTHRNIGYSDAAELFVFLAGWGLHYVVVQRGLADSSRMLLWHLARRALRIYAAQILIISVAIAILAATSVILDNPLVITWHNAEAVFYDPIRANIGLVTLTHQLGYFNILPLYVVLTMFGLVIAFADRSAPRALLAASISLYLFALVFEVNFPTWPVDGEWFFNPLAWQLIFVLGFVLAKDKGPALWVGQHIGLIRIIASAVLVMSAIMVWNGWFPDPTKIPEPRTLFIDYKTYQTPIRLVHFLALAAVFSAAFPLLLAILPRVVGFLSLLGRNSLNVFCVGSILSLLAQILRFAAGGTLVIDTAILLAGVIMMGLTAVLTEWPNTRMRPS